VYRLKGGERTTGSCDVESHLSNKYRAFPADEQRNGMRRRGEKDGLRTHREDPGREWVPGKHVGRARVVTKAVQETEVETTMLDKFLWARKSRSDAGAGVVAEGRKRLVRKPKNIE